MIKLTMLFSLLLGMSCSSDKIPAEDPDQWKITKKEYSQTFTTLPPGICVYTYGPDYKETQDSCNKYNIGDQINHKQ